MSNGMGTTGCPFDDRETDLVNVKFFRGKRDDVIASQEIIDQSRHARNQHLMGTAKVTSFAPKSAHPTVDLRDLIPSFQ